MNRCPVCGSAQLESRTITVREPSGEVFTDTYDECLHCGAKLLAEDTAQQESI